MGRYACIAKSNPDRCALVLALCVVAMIGACTGRERPEELEPIVIGVIAPVASSFFRSGPPTVEGVELAAAAINAAGGVAVGAQRRKLRLIVEDSGDRPETAVSKAFKLISRDHAVALVGLTVSNSALAVAKVAEEQGVPMISTTSTNTEITRGRRFVFRTIFDDSVQGRIMAEFAANELRASKAAVVSDPGSAYSQGFAAVFGAIFERQGGEVIVEESYTSDDNDVSERLIRLQRSAADAWVVPVYPVLLTSLLPQVRRAGVTAPVLGGESWGGLKDAERSGLGPVFFSDVWAPDVPSAISRHFVGAYEEAYGKPAMSYAALAYDATLMLAAAIESQGDAAPESIQKGLLSLSDFVGVTGKIRYQGSGDPVRSALIMRLAEDGSAELYQSLSPER